MVQEQDQNANLLPRRATLSLLAWTAALGVSAATAGGPPVAVIEVAADPGAYYALERDGRLVTPLAHRMEIQADDIVTPKAGRRVVLQYLSTGCGQRELAEKTTVSACQPARTGSGGLGDSFSRLFDEMFKRKQADASHTYTTRGLAGAASAVDLPLASWPPAGSTVLAGEKVLFRFLEPEGRNEAPAKAATLEISQAQGGPPVLTLPILAGEFVSIPAATGEAGLLPGQAYFWTVSREGKEVVPAQALRVLDREESERLGEDLRQVAVDHPAQPLLAQALYLQVLSDEAPAKVNLYADSLRLLLMHGQQGEVPQELIQRLRRGADIGRDAKQP